VSRWRRSHILPPSDPCYRRGRSAAPTSFRVDPGRAGQRRPPPPPAVVGALRPTVPSQPPAPLDRRSGGTATASLRDRVGRAGGRFGAPSPSSGIRTGPLGAPIGPAARRGGGAPGRPARIRRAAPGTADPRDPPVLPPGVGRFPAKPAGASWTLAPVLEPGHGGGERGPHRPPTDGHFARPLPVP